MAKSLQQLKSESKSGKTLEELRAMTRFDLGTHKKTRLGRARCAQSGTILHDGIAKKHAVKLEKECNRHCRGKFDPARLRYLTILHELVELNEDSVLKSAEEMKFKVERIAKRIGIWARGVIEIELVNLDLLRRIQDQGESDKKKLTVLNELITPKELNALVGKRANDTKALVHCHVLVDLMDRTEATEKRLRSEIKKENCWNRSGYQVELKKTFKNRTVMQNLHGIAKYGTKGGNEQLHIKPGLEEIWVRTLKPRFGVQGQVEKTRVEKHLKTNGD